MPSAIQIQHLCKHFKSGFKALDDVSLDIQQGEVFALLGPNGAGKTTLISIVCGIANATRGEVFVNGISIKDDYKKARSHIGIVPQELALSMFETVWATVTFSRGLFGKAPDDAWIEKILKDLALWDKKDTSMMALSGGMKRRVLIAKALAHKPSILFLDEPTAGVDVELRKEMWDMMSELKNTGVTIILTTHYIEEAERLADTIGVINKGKIVLVDEKASLMSKLGKKTLIVELTTPLDTLPTLPQDILKSYTELSMHLTDEGHCLHFLYENTKTNNPVRAILKFLELQNIEFSDLHTQQSSLEDIFVNLVEGAS